VLCLSASKYAMLLFCSSKYLLSCPLSLRQRTCKPCKHSMTVCLSQHETKCRHLLSLEVDSIYDRLSVQVCCLYDRLLLADDVLAYHLIIGKGANEILDKGYKNIRAKTASGFTVNITQVCFCSCCNPANTAAVVVWAVGWTSTSEQARTSATLKIALLRTCVAVVCCMPARCAFVCAAECGWVPWSCLEAGSFCNPHACSAPSPLMLQCKK
jgi:hypothetical protein